MALAVPQVGTSAPDFTLDTTAGTQVRLSAFKGKQNVLIAFFPLAFTSTCTAELCAFTEDYSAFETKNVVVVPLSVDSVASLKEFKTKHSMKVDLASDFKRETSRAYGTLLEHTFFSNRAYFLVDKEGIIRWAHVEENRGNRRENSEILAEVAKLQG